MNDSVPDMHRTVGAVLRGEVRPDLVRDETLVDIFAATATRLPTKTALTGIGTSVALSYAELDRRSNAVAGHLVAKGVRPGQFVGLWFERSVDLHVGLLGILKAGGAYLPFDADAPVERIAACLSDCAAPLLLTDARGAGLAGALPIVAIADAERGDPAVLASAPRATPDDPAYAIYTSGSTGKPKGIVVTHRNICHYLRAGNAVLGFAETDVVLQQASVAFDLSLEEIFIPYLVGATLKVAPAHVVKEVDQLPAVLEAEGITVIDTVPTLLSMFDRDVASLRIVVLGGEACPPQLVERFARQGRRLFNTYGPTETTVVATATELRPGESVTIGRPVPNYTAYVASETLDLVPPGTIGELIVGGPGVAAGYINLPHLTAAKFIANPFVQGANPVDPVLYRTGDAVSIDQHGNLAFHGRIDDQVKVRGFRIELGEIEAVIGADPGVSVAAVAVHQHPTAGDTLVAHVVPRAGGYDEAAVKAALTAKLPPYMVPPIWKTHESLPRLASGKVDRKALAQVPIVAQVAEGAEQEPARSPTEGLLLTAAKQALGLPVVGFEADFFTELGGHSLLAARFISEVRKTPGFESLAIRDLYADRTLRKLAVSLDKRAAEQRGPQVDRSFPDIPFRRRFFCGLAQALTLPFIIAIVTLQWVGLLLSSVYLVREDLGFWREVLMLCGIYAALSIGSKILIIALKWLVIGRTKPGVYPLWGTYYFRIWVMQRIVHMTTHKFLQASPLIRIYMRLLGAKVGRDAILGEFEEGAVDLIEIGERTSTGAKVKFANVEVVGDKVYVGRIKIGSDVAIGNAVVIGPDATIGDGAEIGDLTYVAANQTIGAWEKWDGSPAQKTGTVDKADLPVHPQISETRRIAMAFAYAAVFLLVTMIGLLPIFPAFFVLYRLDGWLTGVVDYDVPYTLLPFLAWPAAMALIAFSLFVVVILRWVLLPTRLQPGTYSIYSSLYFRKWSFTILTETLFETLNSLYATMFMRPWYRLMGCRIARGTEISSNFAGRYDLIKLGENNFLGDETIFGDEEVRGGYMTLKRVETGDRVFFGNLSVVPPGSKLENDSLIGVKSRMPASLHVKEGEIWVGSPAIKLPNRQKVVMGAAATYQPPFRMRALRMGFEAFHTSFPTAALITCAYVTADTLQKVIDDGRWAAAFGIFMIAGIAISVVMFLLSVAFKWLMMGRYRPVMKPMWSWWAMRTEAVAVFYGGLSSKMLLDYLRGTPFLPWCMRLYGMKVGKGVWMNMTDFTEYDCVTIGDYCVLNKSSSLQTHLYEDRVMKVGTVTLGKGVTLGTAAVVLYDTHIKDYAQVGPLTLVMKGETLPAQSSWVGAPAQPGVIGYPAAAAERVPMRAVSPALAPGE
jgi:non-ribosomal peptide synthetase-like protein